MLNQIYRAFYTRATGANLLYLALAFGLFAAWVLPWTEAELKTYSEGTGSLDLLFFYSPDEAYLRLKEFGMQGRLFYIMVELTADLFYPLIYALLLSGLIIYICRRVPFRRSTIRVLFLLPLLTMLFDYAENACIVSMLIQYPYRQEGMALMGSVFTSLKWAFLFSSALTILLSLAAAARTYLLSRLRAKSNQAKVPPVV